MDSCHEQMKHFFLRPQSDVPEDHRLSVKARRDAKHWKAWPVSFSASQKTWPFHVHYLPLSRVIPSKPEGFGACLTICVRLTNRSSFCLIISHIWTVSTVRLVFFLPACRLIYMRWFNNWTRPSVRLYNTVRLWFVKVFFSFDY